MATVPDDRLTRLAAMSSSKNVVPARVEFVDIGGLVEGASQGEGLGNRFLGNIREADAVVLVLRSFEDDDVPGPVGSARAPAPSSRPSWRWPTSRRSRARSRSGARPPGSTSRSPTRWPALDRVLEVLSEGTPIYRSDVSADDRELLRAYFLLTNKPVLAVVNVGEDDIDRIDELCAPVVDEFAGRGEVMGMCVQLEAEAGPAGARGAGRDARGSRPRRGGAAPLHPHRLPPARAAHLPHDRREGVAGLDVPGRLEGARSAPASSTPTSSTGFIQAEVIHWDELLEIGSWSKAREVGKLRVEGKDYEVADGDVLEIRFNV